MMNAKPEYVSLLIGTNNISNTGDDNINQVAREIAAGIGTICKIIHHKSPETQILLFSVLPRNEPNSFNMQKVDAVNNIIRTFDGHYGIQFIDMVPNFRNPNGTLVTSFYNDDNLHLVGPGYEFWTNKIMEVIGD